jgi:hypothetical protein
MRNEPRRYVARINKHELAALPASWSERERGQYLRFLFQFQGIDPDGIYRIDYYPYRQCWVVTQVDRPAELPARAPTSRIKQADEEFYKQVMTQFRHTARVAFAAAAASSMHFASFGCAYQLPPKPQELTAADLAKQLDSAGVKQPPVRFNSEGGWQSKPSDN